MKNNTRIPLHDRKIILKGYLRSDNLFDIEALLIDTKHYSVPNDYRGEIKPGEPIHHMTIKITLDRNMLIKAAKAITKSSPFEICKNANKNFHKLVGLQFKPGWRKDMQKILGHTKGCTHIRELLPAIATTAFQTIQGYNSKISREKKKAQTIKSKKKPYLLGSCFAFDPKSAIVKKIWPEWFEK